MMTLMALFLTQKLKANSSKVEALGPLSNIVLKGLNYRYKEVI